MKLKLQIIIFHGGKRGSKRNSIFGFSKKKYNLKRKANNKCIISLPKLSDFHRSLDSSTIFKPKKLLKITLYYFIKILIIKLKRIYF